MDNDLNRLLAAIDEGLTKDDISLAVKTVESNYKLLQAEKERCTQRIQELNDYITKSMVLVPVEQVCPVCSKGPVVIRSECRGCETVFVGPAMSTYNKNAIAKAGEQ